jgi:hypothetical protein
MGSWRRRAGWVAARSACCVLLMGGVAVLATAGEVMMSAFVGWVTTVGGFCVQAVEAVDVDVFVMCVNG